MSENKYPLISIIVPVYKVEKYLSECIDSILAQTYTDFELLLIDDGSPDRSGEICDEYAARDPRIRVFHKPNGGASSARNLGLDNARGEWICFVDSDDTVDKTYLKSFTILTDENVDLYLQGYKILIDELVISKTVNDNSTLEAYQAYAQLEDKNIINSPCFKLFKRAIISKYNIRFDDNLSFGEDHIFSLDYYIHCRYVSINTCALYNYINRHNESLTRQRVPIEKLAIYLKEYNNRLKRIPSLYSIKGNISAINRRMFNILWRIVVESISNSENTQLLWKYRYIRTYFRTKGLSFTQKVFVYGFKNVPTPLFLIILRIVKNIVHLLRSCHLSCAFR